MVVEAQADPKSGYLDRIQVVKGWLDDDGPHRNAFTMWYGQETTDCNQMER